MGTPTWNLMTYCYDISKSNLLNADNWRIDGFTRKRIHLIVFRLPLRWSVIKRSNQSLRTFIDAHQFRTYRSRNCLLLGQQCNLFPFHFGTYASTRSWLTPLLRSSWEITFPDDKYQRAAECGGERKSPRPLNARQLAGLRKKKV